MTHVIERYWSGESLHDLCREIGGAKVYAAFDHAGIADAFTRKSLPRRDPEVFRRIEALVHDGASQSEISRTTGVGIQTVSYWFPESGWGQGGSVRGSEVRKANQMMKEMRDFL